jgi:F-box/TPR repeat protein Pof3
MLWTMVELPNLERVEVRRLEIEPFDPKQEVGVLPNLKYLALDMQRKGISRRPPFFKPFWIPRDIPDVPTIADFKMRSGYFDRVPNLRELSLGARDGDHHQMRIRVCIDYICHPNLRLLALSNLALYGTWNCPGTLEHLHLTDCNILSTREMSTAPLVLPHLKSLVLRGINCLQFRLSDILQNTTGSLEILEIVECHYFTLGDLLDSNKDGLKNLKKLHLLGMDFYNLETLTMLTILASMPQLKELHVPYTKVTGTLIRKIVESVGVPRVEILNLKGCLDVSVEAVEYGRANGLKIIRC